MRVRLRFAPILLVALVAAAPALADEIVYFTNGTAMPIRAHTVEKGMIRVDLGGNSVMAFPASMVERIEVAGRAVYANPAYTPANQAVGGASDGNGGRGETSAAPAMSLTGAATRPARFRASARRRAELDPEEQLRQNAMAAAGAVPDLSAAVPRHPGMRVVNLGTREPGDPPGTFHRGDQVVMTPPGLVPQSKAAAGPILSLQPRPELQPATPPPPTTEATPTDPGEVPDDSAQDPPSDPPQH